MNGKTMARRSLRPSRAARTHMRGRIRTSARRRLPRCASSFSCLSHLLMLNIMQSKSAAKKSKKSLDDSERHTRGAAVEINQHFMPTFSFMYLVDFVKSSTLCSFVQLMISNDVPSRVSTDFKSSYDTTLTQCRRYPSSHRAPSRCYNSPCVSRASILSYSDQRPRDRFQLRAHRGRHQPPGDGQLGRHTRLLQARRGWFHKYRSIPVYVYLDSSTKVLRFAKDDDAVTPKAGDDADVLNLTYEAKSE